jgi:hypothetical protein
VCHVRAGWDDPVEERSSVRCTSEGATNRNRKTWNITPAKVKTDINKIFSKDDASMMLQ